VQASFSDLEYDAKKRLTRRDPAVTCAEDFKDVHCVLVVFNYRALQ
jgi:hypothetical protein